MINVFYGRENLNKEKFLYNKIFDAHKRAIVIVPDQYSLEGEKQALKFAKEKRNERNEAVRSNDGTLHRGNAHISLIDVEITTFSRMMYDVFSKQGGLRNVYIDKTGREILISKILRSMDHENMKAFGSQLGKRNFTTLVGDFISQIKLENLTPEDLNRIARSMEDDVEIYGKLYDLSGIFAEYEKAMEGKFTDGEDMYSIFIDKIPTSDYLSGADFWLYGFDSFTGKLYDIMECLVKTKNANLNIVMNYDNGERKHLFKAGEVIINRLKAMCSEVSVSQIDDSYEISKPDSLKFLEKNLYKLKHDRFNGDIENIKIVKSLNPYYESEACAGYIRELLREKGYRKRDIAIISNEGDNRLGILRRILKDYDIDLFVDDRKPIFKESFVKYILGILDSIRTGYSTYYILDTIKNPYSEINDTPLGRERLETYVIRHRIKGTMWKKPFRYIELTENKYPPISKDDVITEKDKEIFTRWLEASENERKAKLKEINELREKTIMPFVNLEEIIRASRKEKETVRRFSERFFGFLENLAVRSGIPDDTMWKAIVSTIDQIVTLIGDEEFSVEVFRDAFYTGLEAVTIGQTPPSVDDLIVGSTQRTRTGPIKALVVLGMNEGIIPREQSDDGILSNYELSLIADESQKIENLECIYDEDVEEAKGRGSAEVVQRYKRAIWGLTAKSENLDREESLAIYRNLAKPTENLWISYVTNDSKGNLQLPSELVEDFLSMFGEDILSEDKISSNGYLVESPKGTLINLAKYLSAHSADRGRREISETAEQGSNLPQQVSVQDVTYEDSGNLSRDLAAMELPEELSVGRTWLLEHGGAMSAVVAKLRSLQDYRYRSQPLEPWLVEGLYGSGHGSADNPWELGQGEESGTMSDLKLSPYKLENFSRCPFKYFVRYGLKPADGEPIEFRNTDIGSMAHKIIEKFCRKMDRENSWQDMDRRRIEGEVDILVQEYENHHIRESFPIEGQEKYMAGRIKEIVLLALEEISEFRKVGTISHSEYEKAFTVVIPSPDGTAPSITIRGVVDRVDYLGECDDKAFTVVDYKTGKDEFNPTNIIRGYNLQLFTYLNAIEETTHGEAEGVGVFYINLRDDMEAEGDRRFLMQGAVIDDMVQKIGDAYIKLNARKPGENTAKNNVLRETFDRYKREISEKINELSLRISKGDVKVNPIKEGTDMDACLYCEFRDICRYSDYYKRVIVG